MSIGINPILYILYIHAMDSVVLLIESISIAIWIAMRRKFDPQVIKIALVSLTWLRGRERALWLYLRPPPNFFLLR